MRGVVESPLKVQVLGEEECDAVKAVLAGVLYEIVSEFANLLSSLS